MNDELFEIPKNQTFTQRSEIVKIKHYKPENLINQHLPIKEPVNKIEINRLRNGCFVDTSTSVDIQEVVQIGGKVLDFYEGVIFSANFKVSPLRKVNDKLFELGQKYKDQNSAVMQLLVKLITNSLYGEQIRTDFEGSHDYI